MDKDIIIKEGDVFCTNDPRPGLSTCINFLQKLWDVDNRSSYSHAGIITDVGGNTFEALWTVKRQNIFIDYKDKDVLIGRVVDMDSSKFDTGMRKVLKYEGNIYPFYRLFLHMLPPLAKYVSTGRYLVCSELVGKFLKYSGAGKGHLTYYKGLNPNSISDMIRKWDVWEVVFEGRI